LTSRLVETTAYLRYNAYNSLMRKTCLVLMTAALIAAAPAWAKKAKKKAPTKVDQSQSRVSDILDKMQEAWDGRNSYQSAFKQTVLSKEIGTTDESTGTVYVVKPNKLRWESQNGSSIQILNGKKLIVMQENKRRGNRVVDIWADSTTAVNAKSLNFLAGKMRFKDLYRGELVSETPEKIQLRLISKGDPAETYVAEIDKASYVLRSLITETNDSRITLEFSDTKTNAVIDDKQFEYQPDSKDVVHNQ
jgi:outer membrane lipoprotein-sorting protein